MRISFYSIWKKYKLNLNIWLNKYTRNSVEYLLVYMGFFTYSDFLSRGRYRDKGIIVNIVTTVEGFREQQNANEF